MKSKLFTFLSYSFIISVVVFFVLGSDSISKSTTLVAIRYVCLAVAILIAIYSIVMLITLSIENKKIDSIFDSENYDELIAYIEKKKKFLLSPERIYYYNFYLLLSYLCKDDDENIIKYFNEKQNPQYYPIILYWKAGYDLFKNETKDINDYYQSFINNSIVKKNYDKYEPIIFVFECFNLYAKQDIENLKEALKKVDESVVSIPSTLKVLNTIKSSVSEN